MKRVNLIRRKPGTTREAFQDYYENNHAPLGSRYFPFEWYRRNHLVASIPEDVGFDVVMENAIDIELRKRTFTAEVDKIFAADEARFMNAPPRPAGVQVVEHLLTGFPQGVDRPGQPKAAWLISADGIDQVDFVEAAKGWGLQLAAQTNAERSILDVVTFRNEGTLFTADALLTLWLSESRMPKSSKPPKGVKVQAQLLMAAYETPPEVLKANFGKH